MTITAEAVQQLPVVAIIAGDNDRTVFDDAAITELAASIKENGLAQPITARPLADGRFEIVAGERRFRAACSLGWSHIPALVRELDDATAARIMLAENLHRVDLDPIDEANTYAKWQRKFGYDEKQVAAEANVKGGVGHVRKRLALLALIPDVQLLVRKRQLSVQLAECMVELNEFNQAQAVKALGQLTRLPTVADFRRICGALLEQQNQIGFDFGDVWGSVVTEDGKVKRRRLPVDERLPKPDMRKKNGKYIGTALAEYADLLKAQGFEREAAAIYTATQHLVDVGRLWLDQADEE